MEKWTLPVTADIGGISYYINADYRDILTILNYLNGSEDDVTKHVIALALFFEGFDRMPQEDYREAFAYLSEFINCGETSEPKDRRKLIDWDQDYPVIAAEINKAAGFEVREVPYMHWFTFIGHFNSIGEGRLSSIVSIRVKKLKGKKLEKWEQEFYRENKDLIDFKVEYSAEEQAEIDRLNALLGR